MIIEIDEKEIEALNGAIEMGIKTNAMMQVVMLLTPKNQRMINTEEMLMANLYYARSKEFLNRISEGVNKDD